MGRAWLSEPAVDRGEGGKLWSCACLSANGGLGEPALPKADLGRVDPLISWPGRRVCGGLGEPALPR